MKKRTRNVIVLICLIVLFLGINYGYLDRSLLEFVDESETVVVERVIDGDTIDVGNRSVRLLGINTPERGEDLYTEAKAYLESKVLNKTVTLEYLGPKEDRYGRTLAYVIVGEENVNKAMVRIGFANYYFYDGRDKYSEDLLNSWKLCIQRNINLCEKSTDICVEKGCISIEKGSIVNSCDFTCNIDDWTIKGEGRERFTFNDRDLTSGEELEFSLNLENSGGGLFLRDADGKLVLWEE